MQDIKIRKAVATDIGSLVRIYTCARIFMAQTGNPSQWVNGYPAEEDLLTDISNSCLYVCEDRDGTVVAAFCLMKGPDLTYTTIEHGRWQNDSPYHVIHRLASDGTRKGIARICLDWCLSRDTNLRIDTHKDNIVMQHILESHGFRQCGIIRTSDGSPRLAYQYINK